MNQQHWKRITTGLATTTVLLVVPALALASFAGGAWHSFGVADPQISEPHPAVAQAAAAPAAEVVDPEAWEDTATSNAAALATAHSQLASLQHLIKNLKTKEKKTRRHSLVRALYDQRIKQLQYEVAGVNRLIHDLQSGRLHGRGATTRLHQVQTHLRSANTRLAKFQVLENRQGHASIFTFIRSF